ncbi:hypothetical protein LCGC14_0334740 [marine sediment metagenome]|uniref:DNA polymerase III beta sliding clamp central domain-containing protein n=1 Tax=marine sediment metagenome TaxID=412755 RepID=A0A0F9W2T0_9ZZZZ
MKMIVNQKELSKALTRLNRIAPKKDTMPILGHVLLNGLVGHKLKAVVTNLEVFSEILIEATGAISEPLTVEVLKFKKIVAALSSNESVSLERADVKEKDYRGMEEHKIKLIVSGLDSGTAYTLPAGVAAEFPTIKTVGGEPKEVPTKDLLAALQATTYAISNDEYRYNIHTLSFEPDGDETIIVATDGHRLAAARVPFRTFDGQVLIPRGMAIELEKMLPLESDDVLVYNDDGHVGFEVGGMMLHAKKLEAQYPDWRQIVPKNFAGDFTIDSQALCAGVKRITALASGDIIGVTIVATEEESCLKARTDGVDATEPINTTIKMPGEFVVQKPYILDAAKALGPGLLRMQVPENNISAAKISRADEDDGSFAVVMGIRI